MIALLALAAIPAFNTAGFCSSVAEAAGGHSYAIEAQCRTMEADALDRLLSASPPPPADVSNWCARVATATGDGSYQMLAQCIKMELAARQRLGR